MYRLVILFQLVLTIPLYAQTTVESFLPNQVDSRSVALGRTSIMSASQSNAVFSNPALLGDLTNASAQLGARMFFGVTQFDAKELAGVNSGIDVDANATYVPQMQVDHASFALPLSLPYDDFHLALGLGFHTRNDFGGTTRISASAGSSNARAEVSEVTQTRGGVKMITPAVALNLGNRLSLGLAYSHTVPGDITSVTELRTSDDTDRSIDHTRATGSFLTLSGKVNVSDNMAIGVSYQPAHTLSFHDEDGSQQRDALRIGYPEQFGVGVSYQTNPTTLVVGEIQTRAFSRYTYAGNPYSDNIKGAYNVRLGAEFSGPVPVRFGVFRDALLVQDIEDLSPFVESERPKALYGATGGFGFDVSGIKIDTALEYGHWSQTLGSDTRYKEHLFRLHITAGYTF